MKTTTPAREERATGSLVEQIRDHVAAHNAWADEVVSKADVGLSARSREFLDAQRNRLVLRAFALLKRTLVTLTTHASEISDLEQLVRVRESELTLERVEREKLQRRYDELLVERALDPESRLPADEVDRARDAIEADVRARCH